MKIADAVKSGIVQTASGGWRIGPKMYDRGQCSVCQEECFVVRRSHRKTGVFICSVACRHKYIAATAYGGKTINTNGYVEIHLPGHKMAKKCGAVLEHRLVVSYHIGRPLADHEVVHHKDGNRQNNAIDNLELVNGQREHAAIHRQESELYQLRQTGQLRCSACREIKPVEAFDTCKTARYGYKNQCKACRAVYHKKTHPDARPYDVVMRERHKNRWLASDAYQLFLTGKKECRQCREVKSLDDFSPFAKNLDGKMSYCRPCRRANDRAAQAAKRERAAA